MAINAYGDWVTVKSVTKLASNDSEKSPCYKGIVHKKPASVSVFAEGDEIHFRNSDNIISAWHSGSSQDIYWCLLEDVLLYDN